MPGTFSPQTAQHPFTSPSAVSGIQASCNKCWIPEFDCPPPPPGLGDGSPQHAQTIGSVVSAWLPIASRGRHLPHCPSLTDVKGAGLLCRLPQAGCQLRYAFVTQRGFYPESRQKSNQDAVFAKHHFADGPENLLFAVYDGHGSNGTLCAQFSKEQVLPLGIILLSTWPESD